MEDLREIKLRRKQLGLTQAELARLAGVSQSLIAKIESNLIDPSYGNAKKIFLALSSKESAQDLSAKDIMIQKIISLDRKSGLKSAISKMKKYEISQLPVMEGSKVVGYVSEKTILDAILGEKDYQKVEEIMESPPPIVPEETTKKAIVNLLKYFPLILISDRGRLKGIITRADLLRSMY